MFSANDYMCREEIFVPARIIFQRRLSWCKCREIFVLSFKSKWFIFILLIFSWNGKIMKKYWRKSLEVMKKAVLLHPHSERSTLERWVSGWNQQFAKLSYSARGTGGSNPPFSAKVKQTSGYGAVRLAHLLWEQGVEGSNPFAPTMKIKELRKWLLFSFSFYTHI